MEEIKLQPLQQITHSITIILRYFASGFTAVIIYMFLFEERIGQYNSWSLFFLAISIGFLTYAFHTAYMDKLFFRAASKRAFKKYGQKPICKILNQLMNTLNVELNLDLNRGKEKRRLLHFAISTQTYLRSISENRQIQLLQKELERRLSLLCFIYCSCYQVAAISSYFLVIWAFTEFDPNKMQLFNLVLLLIALSLLILFGIQFNIRIFLRDFWVINTFPQTVSAVTPIGTVQVTPPITSLTMDAQTNNINTLLTTIHSKLQAIEKKII